VTADERTELEAACLARFRHMSTPDLIRRMERAPDFGYDDEEVALTARLREKGQAWRWDQRTFTNRVEVVPLEGFDPGPDINDVIARAA
jgi:hypothetical protein